MFKLNGESIIVTAPILEVYLPEDYAASELYSVVGEYTKWFAIANFKVFKNEAQLEHRDEVPTRPIGRATNILSKPSETDIGEVTFVKGGDARKCIILRFYMNDVFCVDRNVIKSADNVAIMMQRLESGKLDNIPPRIVKNVINVSQGINGINLRLPDEHMDAMIAERYRDPKNKNRKLRFSTGDNKDRVVSVTPREDAVTSTTFQAFTFEDVNNSIIAACNRKDAGIQDEATIMEKIIRGEKIEAPEI